MVVLSTSAECTCGQFWANAAPSAMEQPPPSPLVSQQGTTPLMACSACRKAHHVCTPQERPCKRCIRLGTENLCVGTPCVLTVLKQTSSAALAPRPKGRPRKLRRSRRTLTKGVSKVSEEEHASQCDLVSLPQEMPSDIFLGLEFLLERSLLWDAVRSGQSCVSFTDPCFSGTSITSE